MAKFALFAMLTVTATQALVSNGFRAYYNRASHHNSFTINRQKQQQHQQQQQQQHQQQPRTVLGLSNDDNKNIMPKTIKILALHGKGESGESFHQRISPLLDSIEKESKLQVDCQCIDAPIKGGKWWDQLPHGSRSYEALEYNGYETSKDLVSKVCASQTFDVLIGHSQGAILIASMLINRDFENNRFPPKLLVVLNGVAWPNPYKDNIQNLEAMDECKILFVIGNKDDINPIEGALKVKDAFQASGTNISTVFHPNGHSPPVNDQHAVKEIVAWIISNLDK